MIGVTAALVAQVANSSLQQEYVPKAHWIVPALLTSSLIIALLSVYNSFALHDYLAGIVSAEELRQIFRYKGQIATSNEQALNAEERRLVSVRDALGLWLPSYLVEVAILLYITTICVYWGVAWGMDLEESGARSRKVCFNMLIHSIVWRADK